MLTYEINRILLENEKPSATLRQLYLLYKQRHQKVSFSYICKRTGIPSKGYLAFVMNGQRRLNAKYWHSICETFKLDATQTEMMYHLFARDKLRPSIDTSLEDIETLRTRLRLSLVQEPVQ